MTAKDYDGVLTGPKALAVIAAWSEQEDLMLRSPVVAVPLLLFLAGSSGAQPAPMKNDVRVQVNVSFYVRGSMDEADASVKAQEQARKVLYESAGRECEVPKASVATECRLESINVNMNRNYNQQQGDGFYANGNFSYHVTLK
jgi:hypothetical protein